MMLCYNLSATWLLQFTKNEMTKGLMNTEQRHSHASLFLYKKTFLLVLLVVASFSVVFFRFCQGTSAFTCVSEAANVQDQAANADAQLAPNYFVYSADREQAAHANGKVVLYFWAPWCSTCTSLDLELQDEVVQVPQGVTIFRLNYDQASEQKRRYNVVTQHTFVQIDANGQPLAQWVGGDITEFSAHLK